MKKLSLLFIILWGVLSTVYGASVTLKVGYANNPGEPLDQGVREWKRLLLKASNGTMKLEIFPSSQLGSKNDLIDQMLAGDSVITLADGAFYADRGVADFGITFGPFLLDSWDNAWALTKSNWWKGKAKLLEKKGLKILVANWKYGSRHILSKRAIRKVSDLKGLKIRVPNNTIQVKGFEVLGATPTPMPLGDVYTALQQGTIDALENPIPVLYNGKFHEVAKYLTLDGHVKNFTTFVISTDVFNSLSKKQQKLLIKTGEKAGIYNNKVVDKSEDKILAKFKKDGVTIIKPNIAEFEKKSKRFYSLPVFTSIWSKDLYKTVKKASQIK